MEWDGVRWVGKEWGVGGWDGMGCGRKEWGGVRWDGMAWGGMRNGAGWDGVVCSKMWLSAVEVGVWEGAESHDKYLPLQISVSKCSD